MKRRPREGNRPAIWFEKPLSRQVGEIGLVLSGGGSRAAYQAGALKALIPYLGKETHPISVVVGSSIGAINGLVFAACLKTGIGESVKQLELLWKERNFRNTFSGSPSQAFIRAIRIAVLQYMSPGPNPTNNSVFNPTPLMNRIDSVLEEYGGLDPEDRSPDLESVAVMTTIEGPERKPMLFVSSHRELNDEEMLGSSFEICYVKSLTAKHGFASAALPSILPPVELDTIMGRVSLVDGGISQNIPVDPAARLGAKRVIVIDVSGRNWWFDHYGEAQDTRPTWEVPAAMDTFCLRPPDTFVSKCQKPLGPLLKLAVGTSRSKFMRAVGPTWPIFTLLSKRFGEDVAYEAMSYVALDEDYIAALMERGYNETMSLLRNQTEVHFEHLRSYEELAEAL